MIAGIEEAASPATSVETENPCTWKFRRLGDLGRIVAGGTPSRGVKDFFEGEIPWVKTLDLNNGYVETTEEKISEAAMRAIRGEMLPPETVMVAMYGGKGTIGKSGLLGIPAVTNQAVCAILPNPDEFDSGFLHYALIHIRPSWMPLSGGNRRDPNINKRVVANMVVRMPCVQLQRRIATRLREQMEEAERARAAVQAQMDAAQALVQALLRESLKAAGRKTFRVPDCLAEVTEGIGQRWSEFPVLGATRAGLAPAKESVGKNPGRYKPITSGTVFYNPMRILLGSIAIVDEGDQPGITSPDYVAMRGIEGRLHATWFYHWFRSDAGAAFIKSLTRGAVRERLLFNRLAKAEISVPSWETQLRVVSQLREVKKLRESFSARLTEIERLPAALLRAAFTE